MIRRPVTSPAITEPENSYETASTRQYRNLTPLLDMPNLTLLTEYHTDRGKMRAPKPLELGVSISWLGIQTLPSADDLV